MPIQSLRCLALACSLTIALGGAQAQPPASPPPFNDAAAASAASATAPVAVVAVSSYAQLMADVDYLGGLVGFPAVSQMVEAQINGLTANKGLAGLDKTKPIGLVVDMSMMMPNFGLYVPVTDQPGLLATLAPFGIASTEMGGGITQVAAMGQDLYAKNTGGWMLLGMSPAGFESMPADPTAALTALSSQYDVALQLNVQSVPEGYRQQGLQALTAASQNLQPLPGESAAALADRKTKMEEQLAPMQRLLTELDALILGLAINGEQQSAYLDFNMRALPGSELAAELVSAGPTTTNFAGFNQPEAAVTAAYAGKLTPSSGQQMAGMLQAAPEGMSHELGQGADEATRTQIREALGEIIGAVGDTFRAGSYDAGATVMMAPGATTVAIGGLVAEPARIESGLKKLAEAMKKVRPDAPAVAWGAETHGGVTFHTLQTPVADEHAQQMFGSTASVVVGIGPQAAYVAFGTDPSGLLKAVIDGSAAQPGAPTRQLEVTATVTRILQALLPVAEESAKPHLAAVADSLAQSGGLDHVRIFTQPIENGSQTRIQIEQGVLQAVGQAAMAQALAGAGAPGAASPPPPAAR
ncbi:MAG TPA: hypothetical protein VEQ85_04020 [Lacipirellulaceae bacterium]|nr:hypothetical protein [Lacipirellulaceae bacterium]